MQKKIIIILLCLLFSCGCSNIRTTSIEEIIENKIATNYNNKVYNIHHQGYKYYLPKGLTVKTINETNEIITTKDITYYLYVDLVSIYNEAELNLEKEENIYKYLEINYKDKKGYLKIKTLTKDYLVEIMYNYAKIEVIVDDADLNVAINNAITILSTMSYNKNVIANLMEDNLLNSKDVSLNILENQNKESNFIQYEQNYDEYAPDTPDYDVIDKKGE